MKKQMENTLALFDTVKAHNTGSRVELMIALGPRKGEGSGVFISILGKDSDVARTHTHEQTNRWLQKVQKARKRGVEINLDSSEVIEEKAIETVAALTTGWENMPEPFATFNRENAVALYTQFPDIRRQMDEAAGGGADFLPS